MKIQGSGVIPSSAGRQATLAEYGSPQYLFLYLGLTSTRGHQSSDRSILQDVAKQLLVKSTKILSSQDVVTRDS